MTLATATFAKGAPSWPRRLIILVNGVGPGQVAASSAEIVYCNRTPTEHCHDSSAVARDEVASRSADPADLTHRVHENRPGRQGTVPTCRHLGSADLDCPVSIRVRLQTTRFDSQGA